MSANLKIAREYSAALFFVARKKAQDEDILREISLLQSVFAHFSKEVKLLNDPIYKDSVRLSFIEKIGKKCKFSKIMINFLNVLALKRRFDVLDEIVTHYASLFYKSHGVETIELTSVEPLTKAELKDVEEFFTKELKKKIRVDNIVDQNIIGGVIVRIGSIMLDGSVLNSMNRLKLVIEEGLEVE